MGRLAEANELDYRASSDGIIIIIIIALLVQIQKKEEKIDRKG